MQWKYSSREITFEIVIVGVRHRSKEGRGGKVKFCPVALYMDVAIAVQAQNGI